MQETPQQYTQRVLGYLEGKEAMEVLSSTPAELERLVKGADRARLDARPTPDRWSPTEILAHMADTEIVYAFRIRLILGTNGTPIQGIDQDAWARTFDYPRQDPTVSRSDFRVLRERNLRLLRGLSPEAWERYGMHSERGRETVRRVVEMLAGHDINHLRQVQSILGK